MFGHAEECAPVRFLVFFPYRSHVPIKVDVQFYRHDLPLIKTDFSHQTHAAHRHHEANDRVFNLEHRPGSLCSLKAFCYYVNTSVSVKYRLTHAIYADEKAADTLRAGVCTPAGGLALWA